MNIRIVGKSAAQVRAVPVVAGTEPPKPQRAKAAGFLARAGEVAEVGGRKRRILLLGLGKTGASGPDYEAAGALAAARLFDLHHIALDARGLKPADAVAFLAGALLRTWRFEPLITRPTPPDILPDRCRIDLIDLIVDDRDRIEAEWARVEPALEGVRLARDLVATPSNLKPPIALAAELQRLATDGIAVEILDAATLQDAGFGALTAVGAGSAHPPCLAILRWNGTIDGPPLALVGKGLTFDTGGISLKPPAGMWEMRADMAGAAACAGALLALAKRRSPARVVAILPLAENAIGAASFRPGDVLRSYDGTTIEIVDTDAEGRLVLADALAWTLSTLAPRAIIDLATLTGSIVTALGHHMAGLFCSDDALAAHVAAAGAAVGEPCWRMPLAEGYKLQSDIADVKQCSDGTGQPDACHAAALLQNFVGATPWAHLDIAGVESRDKSDDRWAIGPTGWGVRLLDRLIADRYEDPTRP